MRPECESFRSGKASPPDAARAPNSPDNSPGKCPRRARGPTLSTVPQAAPPLPDHDESHPPKSRPQYGFFPGNRPNATPGPASLLCYLAYFWITDYTILHVSEI